MATLAASPVHVDYSAAREDTGTAWLLGHALGLHSELSEPPAGYTRAEADAFREGWHLGELSRRLAGSFGVGPRDQINAYYSDLHGDDHDAQPDPNDLLIWTIDEAEWREVSAGFVREVHEVEAERVLGHRFGREVAP